MPSPPFLRTHRTSHADGRVRQTSVDPETTLSVTAGCGRGRVGCGVAAADAVGVGGGWCVDVWVGGVEEVGEGVVA